MNFCHPLFWFCLFSANALSCLDSGYSACEIEDFFASFAFASVATAVEYGLRASGKAHRFPARTSHTFALDFAH